MDIETTKTKLKEKIARLKKGGHTIQYIPSEKYLCDAFKLDLIRIEKNLISGSDWDRWEDFVYIAMERNPILYGKHAEEIRAYVLGAFWDLTEKYLSE